MLYYLHPGLIFPPSQPRGPLKILYVDNDSVALSWIRPEDDGGADIECYVVQAKEIHDGDATNIYQVFDPSSTTHLMGNLKTGRIYQFRVYAENEAGASDTLVKKSPVRVKANIGKPGRPGKPWVLEEANEGITLAWNPALQDGGTPIVNYIIERRDVLSDNWVLVNLTTVTETQYCLGNLIPGLEYEFRVSAENIAGVGEPSVNSEPNAIKYREIFQSPNFLEELKDQVLIEGQKATFEVITTGNPVPEITWYRNGFKIWDGRKNAIVTEGGNSILTFPAVGWDCEGVVECEAENRAGMAISAARLIVEAPPKMTIPSHYDDGLLFDHGETARIKITLQGKPLPFITWVFNDAILECGARHSMELYDDKLVLTICDIRKRDSGNYALAAVNRHGQDCVSFDLTINDVPDAPSPPSLVDVDCGSAELKWAAPTNDGGSRITEFSVYQCKDQAVSWDCISNVRNTCCEINELEPGHKYSFRILARNIFGSSEMSEPCHIYVHEDSRIEEIFDRIVAENSCECNMVPGLEISDDAMITSIVQLEDELEDMFNWIDVDKIQTCQETAT